MSTGFSSHDDIPRVPADFIVPGIIITFRGYQSAAVRLWKEVIVPLSFSCISSISCMALMWSIPGQVPFHTGIRALLRLISFSSCLISSSTSEAVSRFCDISGNLLPQWYAGEGGRWNNNVSLPDVFLPLSSASAISKEIAVALCEWLTLDWASFRSASTTHFPVFVYGLLEQVVNQNSSRFSGAK